MVRTSPWTAEPLALSTDDRRAAPGTAEPRPRDMRWGAAALLAGAVALTFDPIQPTVWQWGIVAVAAVAMTWLLRSAVPTLLTVLLLAGSHTDLQAAAQTQRLIYPTLATMSAIGLALVLGARWRRTMIDTRSARHAERAERRSNQTED